MIKRMKMKKSNDMLITNKKVEILFCVVVLVIFIILLFNAFRSKVFLPATLIMGALELFSIGYYFRNDEKKERIVYILFGSGTFLLIIAVIYTIFNVV